jgi:hypothetical protein
MSLGTEWIDEQLIDCAMRESRVDRCCREGIWLTADRREIRIVDMDFGHLANTIVWLRNHPHYFNAEQYLEAMRAELKKRQGEKGELA